MAGPHISLAAEKIGSIFGWPITNSILMTWLVMGFLTVFAYLVSKNVLLIPNSLRSIAEVIIDGLYTLFKSVVGENYIDRFFPIIATIFLFVIANNWAGLLPGVGSIGLRKEVDTVLENVSSGSDLKDKEVTATAEKNTANTKAEHTEFIPLLRGATADLNTTLAIAIIAVAAIQYYGAQTLGLAYFKKFINLSSPIMFGVGLLEIVSEFSRIISFAFRLFGNIFAGEVLLTVIAFLMPLFAPLPFLGLELFVGFIQALVFSMLTAVFLNMATISHNEH